MYVDSTFATLNSEQAWNTNALQLQTLEAQLATGQANPSPATNPADTMISTQMQGQLGVLSQTAQNTQQNLDTLQTASGATQSIQGILQQMQALAVQASNSTETSQDRTDLQAQLTGLLGDIQSASQVQYNGLALLNAPQSNNPVITAVSFNHIGSGTEGDGLEVTIQGYGFNPIATQPDAPSTAVAMPSENVVEQFSYVNGPPPNNPDTTVEWWQGGNWTPSDFNQIAVNYTQWSSTTVQFQGFSSNVGTVYGGVDVGDYSIISVEGANGQQAGWSGFVPSVATTFTVPLPSHIMGSGSTALTLPVVTPMTLGVADLSLTTANGAQDAMRTITTAITRLSTAQAQLGSQQDALQAQQTTTHTQLLQLQSSDATLTNVNLPQVTQQMNQAQVLQQSGLHVLVDERTLQQQAAQVLQSIV